MKNKLLKLIGYQHNYGGRDQSYRFTWGEIALWKKDIGLYWSGPEFCYAPNLIIKLFFFTLYIRTPAFGVKNGGYDCNGIRWGFYLYPSLVKWEDICFLFGNKSKHISMPWTYDWEKTEHLDWDMNPVVTEGKSSRLKRTWEDYYKQVEQYRLQHSRKFDYTYHRTNGEVQCREAKVTIERRTWGMRWWRWKKYIRTSIEVQFNEEVGEKVGTWKGGCVGCGYDILPGETPEQTLRRMEQERIFN